jgi:hypothetical protein
VDVDETFVVNGGPFVLVHPLVVIMLVRGRSVRRERKFKSLQCYHFCMDMEFWFIDNEDHREFMGLEGKQFWCINSTQQATKEYWNVSIIKVKFKCLHH